MINSDSLIFIVSTFGQIYEYVNEKLNMHSKNQDTLV